MDYTQAEVDNIVKQAREAGYQAAMKFFREKLGGRDQMCCGFAWTNIYGVKGNTKLGKMLAAAGVRKNSYEKSFQLWNPSGMMVQNVETLEEGARAAAEVFKRYGFTAYAGSRLD
jgi:hypothetical protein